MPQFHLIGLTLKIQAQQSPRYTLTDLRASITQIFTTMKRAITFILFLLSFNYYFSQEVPMFEINSDNVLDYYSQISKSNLHRSSVSVAAQIGNNNLIDVWDNAGASITITQLGDNNTTLYQNYNGYPATAEIAIRGSNNLVHVEGSNSISDGMKMNINANDMTILMRNN